MRSALICSAVVLLVALVAGDGGQAEPLDFTPPLPGFNLSLPDPKGDFAGPLVMPWPDMAADDQTWTRARNKGCSLMAAFGLSDAQAANQLFSRQTCQSPFVNFPDDKDRWFWHEAEYDDVEEDWEGHWGVGALLNALRSQFITVEKLHHQNVESNVNVNFQTYKPYGPNGGEYRATGASFHFGIDTDVGLIITMNRESPKSAALHRRPVVPDDQLPELNQFSDLAWLYWAEINRQENKDPRRINFFATIGIVNEMTNAVVRRAMESKGYRLQPWPGHMIDAQSDEGRAILGTPNVQGFAYFLITHKRQLGNLMISEIRIFHDNSFGHDPCLLLIVLPVPQEAPDGTSMPITWAPQPTQGEAELGIRTSIYVERRPAFRARL